jgi:hypothetical protein
MKKKFTNKTWIFCTPIYTVLRIHLSPQRKPRLKKKTYKTADHFLHHVQNEGTYHKNLFLQPDHGPSNHELLTVVLHGHTSNNFVALHIDVIKIPIFRASHLSDLLGEQQV